MFSMVSLADEAGLGLPTLHMKKLRFGEAESLIQSLTGKSWVRKALKTDLRMNHSFTF